MTKHRLVKSPAPSPPGKPKIPFLPQRAPRKGKQSRAFGVESGAQGKASCCFLPGCPAPRASLTRLTVKRTANSSDTGRPNLGWLPTGVHPTTKSLGIGLERRVGTPVKGRDRSRSRREAQGLGGRHCGCGGADGGAPAGTPGRRPPPALSSGRAPAGAWAANPAPRELLGGGQRRAEPRCSARCLGLRLQVGSGAGPDAPWLPGRARAEEWTPWALRLPAPVQRGRGRLVGP